MSRSSYTPDEVRKDIIDFFTNPNHWAYKYGNPTPNCNPNVPYHRKQIEVIFESENARRKYDHWDTNNIIDNLIEEGFLRLIETDTANFIIRHDVRYYKDNVRKRVRLITRYSDPYVVRGVGKWGEYLSKIMFLLNNFEIKGRNTNEYKGNKWTGTDENLDFILERDGVSYGVEVKNSLRYIEYDEFTNKLKMCDLLGLIPMWVLRNAPEVQFNTMKANNGRILAFRSQIYPFGQEGLTRDMWNLMRLPVTVKPKMPAKTVRIMNDFHARNI